MLVMGRIGKTTRLTRKHSKTGDGMDLITARKGDQRKQGVMVPPGRLLFKPSIHGSMNRVLGTDGGTCNQAQTPCRSAPGEFWELIAGSKVQESSTSQSVTAAMQSKGNKKVRCEWGNWTIMDSEPKLSFGWGPVIGGFLCKSPP
jgi:hypothetical protein